MANSITQDDAVTSGKVDKAATGTATMDKTNATATSVTFVSGTAKQLNADSIVGLYIAVTTGGSLKIEIGKDANTTTQLAPAQVFPLGLSFVRVPVGWYVKLTGTMSNIVCTAVITT